MKITRQSIQNRIIHWGVALSVGGLVVSGMFQLPLAKRYNIDKLLEWSGEYFVGLSVHYIFAFLLVFFAFFHLAYHILRGEFDIFPKKGDIKNSYLVIKAMITGSKEPPSGKYLPEQRLAYLAIGLTLLLLIVTGLVKTYKNLLGFDIPNGLYFWAAQLHNLGTILIIVLVILHLLAFIPKANRKLLPAMFGGKVEAEYALERHCLWEECVKEARKGDFGGNLAESNKADSVESVLDSRQDLADSSKQDSVDSVREFRRDSSDSKK
ncbi:hypothetical protein CCY99_01085 [Helicobacter sp. 16-1353]|uniref:cytochrome b/b6 domain-containing protein n=1 Tax=Helicobacter sp. 16-1353 TaxID=2004996 RepID=UPI000DCB43BC|nr:cytochrome b/b6 domain-containing protein [Helicobacter sp. 16-1353]RAX55323.1 hypothetical protein CCY99_01085 [Helicobacter sp. 16-1353]